MNYSEYLKSPDWQAKKLEVKKLKGNICQRCGSPNNIHVHHASYVKLGDEPMKHLFVLCGECHDLFHKKYKMGKSMLNKTMNFVFGKGWRKKKTESRKQNFENEFPIAIKSIQDGIPFKKSGVKSIRTWQKATRHLRKQ